MARSVISNQSVRAILDLFEQLLPAASEARALRTTCRIPEGACRGCINTSVSTRLNTSGALFPPCVVTSLAETIDLIRQFFRLLRDWFKAALPARGTGHGFRFIGSQRRFRLPGDGLGRIEALRRLAPGLRGFLNVGANAGFYCLLAERLGIEAVGFEPVPTAFRLLQRNLGLNHSSCLAIPAAVAAGRGRATFYGTGTAGSLLQGLSGSLRGIAAQ